MRYTRLPRIINHKLTVEQFQYEVCSIPALLEAIHLTPTPSAIEDASIV